MWAMSGSDLGLISPKIRTAPSTGYHVPTSPTSCTEFWWEEHIVFCGNLHFNGGNTGFVNRPKGNDFSLCAYPYMILYSYSGWTSFAPSNKRHLVGTIIPKHILFSTKAATRLDGETLKSHNIYTGNPFIARLLTSLLPENMSICCTLNFIQISLSIRCA